MKDVRMEAMSIGPSFRKPGRDDEKKGRGVAGEARLSSQSPASGEHGARAGLRESRRGGWPAGV